MADHIRHVGLLGYPVGHSLSPAMQNAAFQAVGLAWEYVLLSVAPPSLQEAVLALRENGFAGANVTIPHKQAVLPFLHELSDEAEAIGAVNTLVIEGERLLGYNTDAYGFRQALVEAEFTPTSNHAVLLGAGGASRAVLYALLSQGVSVTLVNRTADKAFALARHFRPFFAETIEVVRYEEIEALQNVLNTADLLVNTTSLGMAPHHDTSPLASTLRLGAHLTVYDLVYTPRDTQLLQQARTAGAKTIDGMGMLLHQGTEAFRLWTHREAPVAVMRTALESAIISGKAVPPV